MRVNDTTLFISDLHLAAERPEKIALFARFLQGPASKVKALYILGDLYEQFWIGTDDDSEVNQTIIRLLSEYNHQSDTNLYLLRGNRDFHLNKDFATATGCILIDDPFEIVLDGKKVLIMHGDTLCTDDVDYQNWRRFITNSFVKWIYSIMPLPLRKRIAHGVRGYAAEAAQKKAPEIIDVAQNTVIKTMKKFGVETLIHGHTHRQGIHEFEINAKTVKRIVLGDWYEKDCVLVYSDNEFKMLSVDECIALY